ncbi:MAG TPA: D-amino acid dehydrogenase [Burkholderiaceae bacterium]|nr:D-amino acid dehydrogenase [Burkholderiaceae bacterium]
MRVLVLGAGVVGVASAWFLREAGHEVVVVDRRSGPALETSLANGGQISVSHAEPWANPGAPRKVMGWLGRPDAPLLFRPRLDPLQWRWCAAFLRECTPAAAAANIRAIVGLALHSRGVLKRLRRELALEYDCSERGILHFYTDPAEFRASLAPAALMRELGCNRVEVTPARAVEIEPALAAVSDRIVGADYCAEDESGDAHAFAVALADRCFERGVQFRFDTAAAALWVEKGRARGAELVDTAGRKAREAAEAVVICLGAESGRLLRPLGLRPLIYPGKGYSATFRVLAGGAAPTVSLTDDEYKLVFSRLGSRLRVAGTAEIGARNLELDPVRCAALTRRTRLLFPQACDYSRPEYWAGLRPVTPSNVPYLGPTRIGGLYVNAGHGTLGWTLAAGNGELLARLIGGESLPVALPDRVL